MSKYSQIICTFLFVIFLLQSCELIAYRSGKTKKIQYPVTLNSDDTMVVIVPFSQQRFIDNYQIAKDIQSTHFKNDIKGINYNQYDWLSDSKHGSEFEYADYRDYFENPIKKLLQDRVII